MNMYRRTPITTPLYEIREVTINPTGPLGTPIAEVVKHADAHVCAVFYAGQSNDFGIAFGQQNATPADVIRIPGFTNEPLRFLARAESKFDQTTVYNMMASAGFPAIYYLVLSADPGFWLDASRV